MTAPSYSEIKAQVAAIRQKSPRAEAIGIHSPTQWTGEQTPSGADDQDLVIRQCDSPLAARLALREPLADGAVKVLVTGLEERQLGDDIVMRLAKRRLFRIDPWQIVRSLFSARAIDPRLTRQPWIAEALLERIPPEGYPPARGAFLDADTVWPWLLRRAIGLEVEAVDLVSLLRWSLDVNSIARFRRAPTALRQGVTSWLSEKMGPLAEVLLPCIERRELPDAVPIGLAGGVVFHAATRGKLERSAGKLEERFLGGVSPAPELMQRWSAAAADVVHAMRLAGHARACRQILQRADEILAEVQADAYAHLSDTSLAGFDQRLARFGEQLSRAVGESSWGLMSELQDAREAIGRHDQAEREAARLVRIDMALRLVRWLEQLDRQPEADPSSFADAAQHHLRTGGFADWARLSLLSGDPVRQLSEAYSQLFERTTKIRERQAQRFGQLLADWTAAGSLGDEVIPVEQVLEQVVAPLATEALVLVIVVDGMSAAVGRELLDNVTRHEWTALCEPGRSFNRPAIAVIPSKTEFSRTSLLCGGLRGGAAVDERAGFASHGALVAASRTGFPPVLFHKAGLQESADSVLAADVRKEIASTHRRVVGVVINAVDDSLAKSEQIELRWNRDTIKALPALLHEARIARRLVVLVSDHGHVLECQSEERRGQAENVGGERWRPIHGGPTSGELQIEGPRVLTPGHQLIAPWSERVRYCGKKNGYHGGLSPQEMVIPVVVLASTDDIPAQWSEQPIETPVWWDDRLPARGEVERPVLTLKTTPTPPRATLFALDGEVEEPGSANRSAGLAWVRALLASPVFNEQKRLGGRGVPLDDLFAKLLAALDERGGKLTAAALARTLGLPSMRLPGLLAKAERVLNVDGYDILRRDDASDTVELNRELLLVQFDLV